MATAVGRARSTIHRLWNAFCLQAHRTESLTRSTDPLFVEEECDRDSFAQAHTRARQAQAECWTDDLLAIADDDRLEPNDRRVRLDVRKWLMARLNPARFRDRVQLAGDPDAQIAHVVSAIDLKRLNEAELQALERFADARLAVQDAPAPGN